jgi:nucleoside triphosphate pyrophosphatase
MKLVLASTSWIRAELLTRAGLIFEALRPEIDENALKASAKNLAPGDLAQLLAASKAVSVANRLPEAMVIGADQVLNLEGRAIDKPGSREEAREHLLQLRGRSHVLETAICCARGGDALWQHLDRASLTMRSFSNAFLDDYLNQMGPEDLTSVGAYKLEGLGVQLFEAIEGDYFTILGLPLLQLLDFLRREGALAA